jgi:3-hydroxyacyl-CoA dehydrogenase / 3-hydroxy-2-methylbutyryl-CoA dehydrogenase
MRTSDIVAVVSGGASGLGEATVRVLAEAGARASILDLNQEAGERLSSELGKDVIFCKTDVTDEATVKAAIDKTMETFGAIHVVVNCAGIGAPAKILGKEGPIPIDVFNRVVQINLIGTVNVIRLAAEQMVKNMPNEEGERGVVINTSSGASFEGQIGQASYSASKAAINGMTLTIAREFAQHGIRVMTIAPGLFHTPLLMGLPDKVLDALGKMVPFPSRLGRPIEFAILARHIVENPMLNGEVIRLDGALRMQAR